MSSQEGMGSNTPVQRLTDLRKKHKHFTCSRKWKRRINGLGAGRCSLMIASIFLMNGE